MWITEHNNISNLKSQTSKWLYKAIFKILKIVSKSGTKPLHWIYNKPYNGGKWNAVGNCGEATKIHSNSVGGKRFINKDDDRFTLVTSH